MGTEIEEQIDDTTGEVVQGVAPTRDQSVAHGSAELVQFSSNLRLAYSAGVSLATTAFVPASFSGRPEQVAAAIVTGLELGLTPMAALRSMDIINGTPALRANTLRAIALAKGHEMWVEESTSQRAIVKGRRRGSDQVQESVWDMDRARQMKLAGKDNWQKQPKAMLLARATSELARLIAPDDILGLSYAAEELSDEVVPVDEPVKRGTSRVGRRKKSEAVKPAEVKPEPVETVDSGQGEEPEPAANGATLPGEADSEVAAPPSEGEGAKEAVEDARRLCDDFAQLPEGF